MFDQPERSPMWLQETPVSREIRSAANAALPDNRGGFVNSLLERHHPAGGPGSCKGLLVKGTSNCLDISVIVDEVGWRQRGTNCLSQGFRCSK